MNLRYAVLAEVENFVIIGYSEGQVAVAGHVFMTSLPEPTIEVVRVAPETFLMHTVSQRGTIIDVPIKTAIFAVGDHQYLKMRYGFSPERCIYFVAEAKIVEDTLAKERMWLEGEI